MTLDSSVAPIIFSQDTQRLKTFLVETGAPHVKKSLINVIFGTGPFGSESQRCPGFEDFVKAAGYKHLQPLAALSVCSVWLSALLLVVRRLASVSLGGCFPMVPRTRMSLRFSNAM
jgi:hypothetical protein